MQPSLPMILNTPAAINSEEIACLAFVNWEKDGCPPQLALDYWLEAEHQIKATKHLLLKEISAPEAEKTTATSLKPKTRSKASGSAKTAKCV